ncbi:MAG: hypothetical protein AB7O65_04760, partial [Candidatus Korobacteraceae bacterium]
SGDFALNGTSGPRASAVVPGDRIQTSDAASVSITSTGSNVLVGPNSSVVYQEGAIQFADGSAVVSTSSSMAAQVLGVRVSPSKASGSYRISRDGDKVTIAALKGSLVLSDGAETRTVSEGSAALMPEPVPQAVPGAAQPGGGGNRKVGIILGAGALAAATIIIFTKIGEDPVSPIQP